MHWTQDKLTLLADLAALTYPEWGQTDHQWAAELPDRLNVHGMTWQHAVIESGTEGFDCGNDEDYYIAIRGTTNTFDWLTDLSQDMTTAPLAGNVHAGFLSAAWRLWHAGVKQRVESAYEKRRRIWITGHSLGAAAAICVAAMISAEGIPVDGILALCSPRIGDSAFATLLTQTLSTRLIRIQNNRDPVPYVPLWRHGYHHAQPNHYVYFDRTGMAHMRSAAAYRLWDQQIEALKDGLFQRTIRNALFDHSVSVAVELVKRNTERIVRSFTP